MYQAANASMGKVIRATLEPFFIPGKLYRLDCLNGRRMQGFGNKTEQNHFPIETVHIPHKGILLFLDYVETSQLLPGRNVPEVAAGVLNGDRMHLKFLWAGGREAKFVYYTLYNKDQAMVFQQWFTAIEGIPAGKARKEAEWKPGTYYQEIIQKRQEAGKASKAEHMREVQKAFSKWHQALGKGDHETAARWRSIHQELLEKGKNVL